jgi:hypothetical protein
MWNSKTSKQQNQKAGYPRFPPQTTIGHAQSLASQKIAAPAYVRISR